MAINLIGATGGHSDRNAGLHFRATGRDSDYTDGIADSPADLRKAVRFNVKYGADVIKFCASGGVMSLADEVDTPQLTLDEMTAVVDEAHRLRKRVGSIVMATPLLATQFRRASILLSTVLFSTMKRSKR